MELRGDISKRYTWDAGLDMQLKSGVWQAVLPETRTVSSFEYKYVIVRSGGHIEWEEGLNRIYRQEDRTGIVTDRLRGFDGASLKQDVQVTFELDLDRLKVNGYPIERVVILGSRPPLSWVLPAQIISMNRRTGNFWSGSVLFRAGTPADIRFKFAWLSDGVWQWEHQPGHIDHLLVIDMAADNAKVRLRYDEQSGRIIALAAEGVELNEYEKAARTYGSARSYRYLRAIELLEAGDMHAAWQMNEAHRQDYEPVLIDEFDIAWAHKLAGQGHLSEALDFAAGKAGQESEPWRRAFYHYLHGELLLNAGQYEAARELLQLALERAPEDEMDHKLAGYARLGLAVSYMHEPTLENKMRARPHLLRLASEHPDEQTRRMSWQHLAGLSKELDDESMYEQALQGLEQTGSARQRTRSRIDRLEYRLEHEPPDSVAFEIQWLEGSLEDVILQERVQLLKAEYLMQTGQRDQALEILRLVESRRDHVPASERAANRLKELQENN
jgi:tetratricopeptide (TPR) repeat protein